MKNKECNHNVWTEGETWIDPDMPEYGSKKCEVCILCGYIFPDKWNREKDR
jgi:hypothetical protein